MRLRAVFGWMTIVCIVLAILRRPLGLALAEGSEEWWHCLCAPWYADLYLLNLESCWPFTGNIKELQARKNEWHEAYLLTSLLGCIIWLVLHVVGLIFGGIGIHTLFFATAEEAEEEVIEEEPEEIQLGSTG
jgi:hypothetical protein